MKMKTKVKIACAIAVISKLTLWLGLLIGSIGVAMLVWECNQPLGWKVMMTGVSIMVTTVLFSFVCCLNSLVVEAAYWDYIESCKTHEKDGF